METYCLSVELAGVSTEEVDAMYEAHDNSMTLNDSSTKDGRAQIEEFYCSAPDATTAVEVAIAFVRRHAPAAQVVRVVPIQLTTVEILCADSSYALTLRRPAGNAAVDDFQLHMSSQATDPSRFLAATLDRDDLRRLRDLLSRVIDDPDSQSALPPD